MSPLLEQQKGLTESGKRCLNLFSRIWLKTNRKPVINLTAKDPVWARSYKFQKFCFKSSNTLRVMIAWV